MRAIDEYAATFGEDPGYLNWAALGPRELNTADPEYGREHELILRNLKPDILLLPEGSERPAWCWADATVVAL